MKYIFCANSQGIQKFFIWYPDFSQKVTDKEIYVLCSKFRIKLKIRKNRGGKGFLKLVFLSLIIIRKLFEIRIKNTCQLSKYFCR